MNLHDQPDDTDSGDEALKHALVTVEEMLTSLATTSAPSDLKSQVWNALPQGNALSFNARPATVKCWWWRSDLIALGVSVGLLLFAISMIRFVDNHNTQRLYGAHEASLKASRYFGDVHLADSAKPQDPVGQRFVLSLELRQLLGFSDLNEHIAIVSTQWDSTNQLSDFDPPLRLERER